MKFYGAGKTGAKRLAQPRTQAEERFENAGVAPGGDRMDKNRNPNLNTESWEFSLEAILAEYAAEPEPEKARTPEEQRSILAFISRYTEYLKEYL